MLERFITKEEKEDFTQSVFVIMATIVCSILFILNRIFPRLENVLSKLVKKRLCKTQKNTKKQTNFKI